MTEELPRRAILRDGRRVPVFTVIGPGGTGKSTLAMRMAQMITRAEGGPNVLLVDADLFSRGITASLETRFEVSCGSLHDALFGRQARVQPLDLSAVAGAIDEQQPLQGEGRVFLLPSAHAFAERPFSTVASLPLAQLGQLLVNALTFAVSSSGAKCIVADTTSIAEPCGAALVSVSDSLLLIGSPEKGHETTEKHRRDLRCFGDCLDRVPLKVIFNAVDTTTRNGEREQVGLYRVPKLQNLGKENDEGVVDEMRLAHVVCALVSDTLPRDRSELVPCWLAPLPRVWRSIARRVAQNPPGGWLIFRRTLSGRQGVIALATVAGLLLLTWLGYGQGGPDSRTFVTIGLGLTIVAAGALAAWTIAQTWRCLEVARRLRGADLGWLLSRIELRPSEASTCSPRVRWRRTRRRLRSLTRVFAALSRTIEPESPARQGPEMGPLSQDAPPASAR